MTTPTPMPTTTETSPSKPTVDNEQGMMILLAVIVAIAMIGVMLVGG
jgi:hypothetical protein